MSRKHSLTALKAEGLDYAGVTLYFSRIPECGILPVIRSFADKKTEALFRDERVKEFQASREPLSGSSRCWMPRAVSTI